VKILKKYFYTKQFGDVLGFNAGVSLSGPPPITAWCFLLDDVLIDAGIRHLREPFIHYLEDHRPSLLLITHFHEDHSGNAAVIKDKFGTQVYGHPETARKLKHSFKIRAYQHLAWGKSDPIEIQHAPTLIHGKNHTFRAIHTPGHSRDHTVYLEESKGWLFSGDLFVGKKIKFFRSDECLGDQIQSLKNILNYDFDDLFCAHRPTMGTGKEVIRNKLDFLVNFYGSVKDLHDKGISTKGIIRRLDPANDRFIKWVTLNNACFANMVRSALKLAVKETASDLNI